MRDCYEPAVFRIYWPVLHVKFEFNIFEFPNVKKVVVRTAFAIELILGALMSLAILVEFFEFLFNSLFVLLFDLFHQLTLKTHLVNCVI